MSENLRKDADRIIDRAIKESLPDSAVRKALQEFPETKGKVVLIDDGTCQVNGYCTVGQGGKATASDTNYKVRVLKRIDDTHIQVYIDSVFLNK